MTGGSPTPTMLMLPKPSIATQQEVSARRILSAARYWYDRRGYLAYLQSELNRERDEYSLGLDEWLKRFEGALAEMRDAEDRLDAALNADENIGLPELLAEWEAGHDRW